ncbi:hypothetical protein W97_06423 [Coniosporium apollinis CBS 100218]|uniref:BTB domain-containing protein n=1 Tax=Coniosporium apollinis (strain CBS 100218) TaxID=1168221 RepID=R7YZ02_CONA1|nr:uncharacterized protein W97_06423 [Coniosporium apollinis CBS 100218]EON67170.1 hypothetical protein W97_06423 [Coniosporium apollinis CBS 100218]
MADDGQTSNPSHAVEPVTTSVTEELVEIRGYSAHSNRTWRLSKRSLRNETVFFQDIGERVKYDPIDGSAYIGDIDPDIFEAFAQFLSGKHYEPPFRSHISLASRKSPSLLQLYHTLAWLLGDKLGAVAFQNHAIVRLAFSLNPKDASALVSPRAVLRALESMGNTLKLRQLFVDATAYALQKHGLKWREDARWAKVLEKFPDFIQDVIVRFDEGEVTNPSLHVAKYFL